MKQNKKKEKKKDNIVSNLFKNVQRRKKLNIGISLNLKNKDYMKIKRLLFMGIVLRLRRKKSGLYKVWIRGFSHHYAKARTPVSAYRKMFKKLISMGIYLL